MSPIGGALSNLLRERRGTSNAGFGRDGGGVGWPSANSSNQVGGVQAGQGYSSGNSYQGSSIQHKTGIHSATSGTPGATACGEILGGGFPKTISAGAPFAGRTYGGGKRDSISSGRTYADGAAYTAIGGAIESGAIASYFPFGFWPLYFAPDYYGDAEYGPASNTSRPGGPLAVASFSASGSDSTAPQYLVFGDQLSVENVTSAIISNCPSILITPATLLTNTGSNLTLDPALADSYFRASSFALFNFFANQTHSEAEAMASRINLTLPLASPVLHDPATFNATYHACVNSTISRVLPIEAGSFATGRLVPGNAAVAVAVLASLLVGGRGAMGLLMMIVIVMNVQSFC